MRITVGCLKGGVGKTTTERYRLAFGTVPDELGDYEQVLQELAVTA